MGLYDFDLSKKRDIILATDLESYFATINENLGDYTTRTDNELGKIEDSSLDPWSVKATSLPGLVKEIMSRDLASEYLDEEQKKSIKSVKVSMERLHEYLKRDLKYVQNFSTEDREKVQEAAATLETYISAIKATEKQYNPNILQKSSSYTSKLFEITKDALKSHITGMREFVADRRDKGLIAYNSFGHSINKTMKNLLNKKMDLNIEKITKNNQKIEKKISNKARYHEILTNLKNVFKTAENQQHFDKSVFLIEKCQSEIEKAKANNEKFNENVANLKKNIAEELNYSAKFNTEVSIAFLNHYSKNKNEEKLRYAEVKHALKDFKHNKEMDVADAVDTYLRMEKATFEVDGIDKPLLDSDQLHVIREAMKEGRDVSDIMKVIERAQDKTNLDIPSAENLKIYFTCQEYGYTLDKYPTFEALAHAEPRTFETAKDALDNPVLAEFKQVHEKNMELPLTEMKLPAEYAQTIENIVAAEKSCENIVQMQKAAEQHIQDCQDYTNELDEMSKKVDSLEQENQSLKAEMENLKLQLAEKMTSLEPSNDDMELEDDEPDLDDGDDR